MTEDEKLAAPWVGPPAGQDVLADVLEMIRIVRRDAAITARQQAAALATPACACGSVADHEYGAWWKCRAQGHWFQPVGDHPTAEPWWRG